MNLLRKSAIVAAVAALVALACEAAPAVIALVSSDAAAASPRPVYDVSATDPAMAGFRPANASLAILFDANWR